MIYIITVYWNSSFWALKQLRQINESSRNPARLLAFKDSNTEVSVSGYEKIDVRIYSDGGVKSHAEKLNILASFACEEASSEDVLLFLDSDAFPIADYQSFVERRLRDFDLVAVRRDENFDTQPHPCFCAVKVKTWQEIQGDWRKGPVWKDSDGYEVTDVGARLPELLASAGKTWLPILRSNEVNCHYLFWGIYGDVVYHHGAGSRELVGRQEIKHLTHNRWLRLLPNFIRSRIIKGAKEEISAKHFKLDSFFRSQLDDVEEVKNILTPAVGQVANSE